MAPGQHPGPRPKMDPMTTTTHTRTHVYTAFANPYLTCAQCGHPVPCWHNPDTCGCNSPHWNHPCGHTAEVVSTCPSWSPVHGCDCPPRISIR